MYTRKCPRCKETIEYKNKYRCNYAEKQKLMCNWCSTRKMLAGRTTTAPITEKRIWKRNCPRCNVELEYKNKRNLVRATASNSVCVKCADRKTDIAREKISKSLTGRKYPNRKSNSREGKTLNFKRNCPGCNTELGYASEYARDRANKSGAVCNGCSSRIYKKSWTHVIKDEHRKKMAAKKAGYDTYEAYMADLDNRKKYYRAVRKITRQQDISMLPNYDKLRGLCGVAGAYQLDHIIPVSVGYEQRISAEKIGHISNLQIIPWKENLLKSNK